MATSMTASTIKAIPAKASNAIERRAIRMPPSARRRTTNLTAIWVGHEAAIDVLSVLWWTPRLAPGFSTARSRLWVESGPAACLCLRDLPRFWRNRCDDESSRTSRDDCLPGLRVSERSRLRSSISMSGDYCHLCGTETGIEDESCPYCGAVRTKPPVTIVLCGPSRCEHDYSAWLDLPNGGTAVCSKCGATAIGEAAWL